jgi:hypothetical protein
MPDEGEVEVARNEYGVVAHHPEAGFLELRWLPTTARMHDEDWKAGLELLAGQAERLRPGFLLIDATQFGHRFEDRDRVMAWRDRAIIPRYDAAGIKKFAFHMPPGTPQTMEAGAEPVHEGPASYPTAWFAERANALAWFQGQHQERER